MTNQYPFDALPKRRLILVGKGKPGSLRGELVKLQEVAERKRHGGDAQGNPSESVCSESHLQNILAARDESEAAKLKAVKR